MACSNFGKVTFQQKKKNALNKWCFMIKLWSQPTNCFKSSKMIGGEGKLKYLRLKQFSYQTFSPETNISSKT